VRTPATRFACLGGGNEGPCAIFKCCCAYNRRVGRCPSDKPVALDKQNTPTKSHYLYRDHCCDYQISLMNNTHLSADVGMYKLCTRAGNNPVT